MALARNNQAPIKGHPLWMPLPFKYSHKINYTHYFAVPPTLSPFPYLLLMSFLMPLPCMGDNFRQG